MTDDQENGPVTQEDLDDGLIAESDLPDIIFRGPEMQEMVISNGAVGYGCLVSIPVAGNMAGALAKLREWVIDHGHWETAREEDKDD